MNSHDRKVARELYLAELDEAGIVAGAVVDVSKSREGGRTISYRGTVFAVRPSGTLLIDDESETDGAGTPIRHYCHAAAKITLCRPKLASTKTYRHVIEDLEWLDRNVRLDPAGFANDHLGDVARQLRELVVAVSEGTL